METKFTKGNWYVKSVFDEEYADHKNVEVHCEKVNMHSKKRDNASPVLPFTPHIATIHFGRDNEEREANAKLIAQSPALFKVCTDLLNAFVHIKDDVKGNKVRTDIFKHCPEFRQIAVDARHAIEKATE